MKNWNWKNILVGAWAVLVLPSVVYVVVNGYWWMFDGNILNSQKMSVAAAVSVFGTLVTVFVLGLSTI